MFLAALQDRGGWGVEVCAEAARRGWRWQLFADAEQITEYDGYGFFRIHQHPAWRTETDKTQARRLIQKGLTPVPDAEQIRLYDDKLAQSEWEPLRAFMPRTVVARDEHQAMVAADIVGLPLISKSSKDSASQGVRLLKTAGDVAAEISRAFGAGIQGRYAVQSGYVIFQQFLPGNGYDYRVCAIGRQRMMLRRQNRSEAQPFASGSGKCEAIKTSELSGEERAVLEESNAFFAAAKTNWCGIDLVRDPDTGKWKVLEVTLAWTQKAYAECAFIGTNRRGAEIWSVLCDEIEGGTFQ